LSIAKVIRIWREIAPPVARDQAALGKYCAKSNKYAGIRSIVRRRLVYHIDPDGGSVGVQLAGFSP
jgi:hypothetical protein